jgi:hypothetical protein
MAMMGTKSKNIKAPLLYYFRQFFFYLSTTMITTTTKPLVPNKLGQARMKPNQSHHIFFLIFGLLIF